MTSENMEDSIMVCAEIVGVTDLEVSPTTVMMEFVDNGLASTMIIN